ncbi:hypothetical protein EL22_04695 [Halostagnicola sp. A56]|nr:hypothetical protein EL22_04695 [Halostagnicola sp. A56]
MDGETHENACDNCGSTSEVAYTLAIHPKSDDPARTELDDRGGPKPNDRERAPSETPANPRLVGRSSAIEVRFCSADCRCEWAVIPSTEL